MPSGGGCWRSWRSPGRRTRNWLKTKHYQRETFLVGGFVPDRDQVRSLLVGLPDPARPGPAPVFVRPELAVEVTFLGWESGRLRHPAWSGLSQLL